MPHNTQPNREKHGETPDSRVEPESAAPSARHTEIDWRRSLHSDVSTTLGIYAHSMSEDRLAAQDEMLAAMMTPSNAVN